MLEVFSAETHLISVLLPIYCDHDFLPDCLDSILAQTYQHFELIILDRVPNSGDAEIIRRYQDSRITYIADPIDAQEAIVKLFSLAKGHYIKLFCPDDRMMPHCLESLLAEFTADPNCAAVFSDMKTMNHDGVVHKKDLLFSENFSNRYAMLASLTLNRNPLLYPTVMLNRMKLGLDIFDQRFKQLFDARIWAGIALCYQGEFRYVNKPLVAYRLRKSKGNFSNAANKSVMNRVVYESQQLIDFVVSQLTPDTIFEVFPRARSVLNRLDIKLEKKYLPVIVAVYFLRQNLPRFYGVSISKRFAIDSLFSQMADISIREFLEENCDFNLKMLKNHISEYFEVSQPSYFSKCYSMFIYYLKKQSLWFALRKTYFYLVR